MLVPADWQMIDTLEGLKARTGIDLQIGWNESSADTALVWYHEKEQKDDCILYVWNRPNIRAELIYTATSLPIHRLD